MREEKDYSLGWWIVAVDAAGFGLHVEVGVLELGLLIAQLSYTGLMEYFIFDKMLDIVGYQHSGREQVCITLHVK